MKTKKIKEMAKKIKPGNEDEKALIKKKRPGKVLGTAAEKDPAITERKKAESQREAALKAMVKSENRFRSIFESSHDAIMTLEPPNWKFTSGNPAALKMFMAKDEADFDSHEPWTMSPERQPDGRASAEKAKEMIEIAMRDGSNFFEWTHKRLNGDEFPATILLTRVILAEKTILQATVRDITERKRAESQREAALEALQKAHDELDSQVQERTAELAKANEMLQADITERKRVEEALRYSEVQLQVILESTADGILAIDNMGKVIKTNKRFAELWRIPQDLFDTRDDNAIINYVLNQLVNPEEFLAKVRLLYQSTAEDSDMLVFKDGRIFERFSAPLFMSDSSIGRIWSFRDVTERERAEAQRRAALQALSESEDRYRDLVENSQDLIYTHDLEGKLLSVNEVAVRLTGYPLKDLLSMNMADLLVPEVRHLFKGYMTEIQATGWARGTMRIRTASGKPRYLEYYNTLRTKGVTVAVVRGLGHDITERERAEKIQHIQYNIANAMIKAETLSDFLETVRNELSTLLDTTNFLIALYDEASGMLSAPFEKDEKDAIPQWPAEKSLTGLVIKQKRSMLLRREEIQQLDEAGSTEQIGSSAESWLGVPLLINEKVLGAIVVQSYDKADAYDQNGVSLLEIIANQLSSYIERKQAESQREAALEALQTAFQENRNLLGELQHRAKNSFAMIFGMISLATSAGVSPETKAALDNLGLRVRSVSELYSLLYSAGSFTEVRLDEYCARIAAPLVGLLGNITLNTEMESITVPVKEAAPLGLILTELMTNAGKYAFPGGRQGTITVALKKTVAGARLEVSDDGIGLPAGFDFSGSAGMGLNLVRALSGQINGSFRMEGGATGTRCIVEFAAANNGSK